MVRIFLLPTTVAALASTDGTVERINQHQIKPVRPQKLNGARVLGIPRQPTVGGKSLSMTAAAPSRMQQPAKQRDLTDAGPCFDLGSRAEPTSLVFPTQPKVGGKLRKREHHANHQRNNNGRAWHVRPGHSVVTLTAWSSLGDLRTRSRTTVIVK